ncbi:MAG: choice-of-anchor V domain-containing protein [Candidatus Binatia bacterium]
MMTNCAPRLVLRVLPVVLLLCAVAPQAQAHSGGDITSNELGPSGCNSCHFGGQTPTVTLTGPSPVMPGSTNEYTLTITNIGQQVFGGLDAYAPLGTLSTGGANATQTQSRTGANLLQEITHVGKKASMDGATLFSFMWTAPDSFTSATLNAWGNAVNGDGFSTGDQAALATLTVMSSMPAPLATDTPGPTPTPTPTFTVHDVVVSQLKPLNVTIPSKASSVTKTVSVKLTNADPKTEVLAPAIALTSSSDCPPGVTIGAANFGTFPEGSVSLAGGKSKTGKVIVTVDNTPTSVNHVTPTRCTIAFLAAVASSIDPTVSNAGMAMQLNVINKGDVDQETLGESFIQSPNPITVKIPRNTASVVKSVNVTVGNGDIVSTPPPMETVTVTASDGDCPPGTVGAVSFAAGSGNQVSVKGGKKQTGTLPLTIDSAAFTTASAKSPARCTAVLTATGPADPDADPTNNTATLVIDVLDMNDF